MKLKLTLVFIGVTALFETATAATSIYVSSGSFSAPYYQFYSDPARTNELFIVSGGLDTLFINETYEFIGASGFHPFYLSDVGAGQSSTQAIALIGDGSASSGITGMSQSFTLAFTGFNPATDRLTYYCTAHGNMVGTLNVAVPEPGMSLLLMMGVGLVAAGRRSRSKCG